MDHYEYEENKPHILLKDTYEIKIHAYNLEDLVVEIQKERKQKKEAEEAGRDYEEELFDVQDYVNNVAWVPRMAIDCIYNFFISIKKEMEMTGFKLNTLNIHRDSIPSRVLDVLQKFSPEIRKGKDLEEILLDYIEDLREFNFYPPVEELKEELWELRNFKIEFFKKVLEEYRKDKEGYDKCLEISNEARNGNGLNRGIKRIDGYEKKKLEKQIPEKEKDSHILLEDTYTINIDALNLRDLAAEIEREKERRKVNKQAEGERELDFEEARETLDVKRYRDNVAWVPMLAIDCIHNFFVSIKGEMEMPRIKLNTLNNPDDSTSSKALGVLQNFGPEIQKRNDVEELLLDYIEDLKEFNLHPLIEDLEKDLWKLRSYKIEFFKKVLEEYRKDKKRYDKYL